MVQILGKDETKFRRSTCNSCASILQYSLFEVKEEKERDYTGSVDVYNYIECPSCGDKVYVKGY